MKHRLRKRYKSWQLFATAALLASLVPSGARAQVSAGVDGLSIRSADWFSSEGLALQPSTGHPLAVVRNQLSRSAAPAAIGSGASLPQVYRFAEAVNFSGTVRIRYQPVATAGHEEANLWVFLQAAADEPFKPVASICNGAEQFVQATLANQPVYAITLADPTMVGYAIMPETPDVSAITPQGFTLSWPLVAGATDYQIEVATTPDFSALVPGMPLAAAGEQTSVAVKGLESNTPYYFRLVALDAASNVQTSPTGKVQTTDWPFTIAPATVTYNGQPHALDVQHLPAKATVQYTIQPENGEAQPGNTATDAGSYLVTAHIGQEGFDEVVLQAHLVIEPAVRTLDFAAIGEKKYGEDDFDAGAVASSGEAVIYTSDNTAVATVTESGLIHITGVGTATLTASVAASTNYTTQPTVSRMLTVAKAKQTIRFNAPAEVNNDAGSVVLDVHASSGLPVTLQLDDEQVATLDGSTLTILRLGTVHITATQRGDANHEAAEPVTVAVRVVDPTSSFPVRVHPAVSRNADGINEFLMIEGIRDYPENRVTLFNRNGTVVWEASGYDNNEVAFRGIGTGQQPLPAGTYFYIVEVKDGNTWKYEKGYFILRY